MILQVVLLLLLLIILLAPINYSGKASFDGKPEAHIKVGWLLIIRVPVDFVENKLKIAVKVLGFKVFSKGYDRPADETLESGAEAEAEGEAKKAEDGAEDRKETALKAETQDTESAAYGDKKDAAETGKAESDNPEAVNAEDEAGGDGEAEEESGAGESLGEKLERIFGRIIYILDNTERQLHDEDKKVRTFFNRKSTKHSVDWIKKAVFKIVKHILPRKLTGAIEYGMDDPATTGYITAAASWFYDLYEENFELTPNFNEQIIKGNVEFKGHIILGYIAVIALRLYLRKEFRTFLKNIRVLKDDTMENVEKIKDGIVNYG